jgi:phosphopantetheinyl transferase
VRAPVQNGVAADARPGRAPAVAEVRLLQLEATSPDCVRLQRYARHLLHDDELFQFSRILDPAVRSRRMLCRAWLRLLLAERDGVSPAEVRFKRGSHGRPEACGMPAGTFNVSRSDGLIAIGLLSRDAAAAGCRLGVDIEACRGRDPVDVAAALFDEGELRWLLRQPRHARDAAFLSLWALREAVVKADGRGLALDLRQVRFTPGWQAPWLGQGSGAIDGPLPSALLGELPWHCWLGHGGGAVSALALRGAQHAPRLRWQRIGAAELAAGLLRGAFVKQG